MTQIQQISQRDLRMRSKDIMDAVEKGLTFTVTRDGRGIAELIPIRRQSRFVSRADFEALSRTAPTIDLERFRSDQEVFDNEIGDPYER